MAQLLGDGIAAVGIAGVLALGGSPPCAHRAPLPAATDGT